MEIVMLPTNAPSILTCALRLHRRPPTRCPLAARSPRPSAGRPRCPARPPSQPPSGSPGVHHRDVHGLPDLLGLPLGAVDDPPSLLQGYGLLRLRSFRHNLPFPSLSVYVRSRALAL